MSGHEIGPFACIQVRAAKAWQSAAWLCHQLTPLVEEHREHLTFMLALGGSERLLLGGEAGVRGAPTTIWPLLRDALISQLTDAGLAEDRLTIGIGPTRTLAWLATSYATSGTDSRTLVVLPGQEQAFLAALPVAALQCVPDAAEVAKLSEMVAALDAVGVRTLGRLQRLSAEALARRFGADGARLAVLAAGEDLRLLRPRVEEPWLGARLHLEPPLAAEQLSLALAPLAEKLALTLITRELAAGKIALALESETGKRLQVARRLAHPLGTTQALLDTAERLLAGLLAPVTDSPDGLDVPDVELPAAGERFVTLRLRVGRLHPATAEQRQLWAAEQQRAGAERIERLRTAMRALAGGKHADALLRAEIHDPDAVLPEERYRLAPRTPRPT